MSQKNGKAENGNAPVTYIVVWDLPTRLFHWLIVVLVFTCVVTGKIGVDWLNVHMICGYGVLTLLLFRLSWGFVGGYHARFANFVRSPVTVVQYAANMMRKDGPRHLGHNPLGGWSVMAMLGALLLQASTGLFTNDDIFTEGPLYPLVSKAASDFLTRIHRFNADIIGVLVAIHILAILFYLVVKRENLIKPMITGTKYWRGPGPQAGSSLWAAGAVAGLCGIVVYFIVKQLAGYFR